MMFLCSAVVKIENIMGRYFVSFLCVCKDLYLLSEECL